MSMSTISRLLHFYPSLIGEVRAKYYDDALNFVVLFRYVW
jgi:hypothetical protein